MTVCHLFFLYIRGNYKLMNAMKTVSKSLLLTFLSALSLLSGCKSGEDNSRFYRENLEKIIVDENIPLIQLRYISPEEDIALQIENPAYKDSLSTGCFQGTPEPAVFQAASLSKPVFAYIVMKLYENGELDLDKPLYEYTDIDRFVDKEMAKKLTARIVLSHRSGLPNWSKKVRSDDWHISPIKFIFPVDSCFGYSGEAFAFLQRAVEKIRGKAIEEIAKEEVFEPLGMEHTSYIWIPAYDTLAVDGYNKRGISKGVGYKHVVGNVGYSLRTTAEDYSKFIQALLNGTGLKPETAQFMLEPNRKPIFKKGVNFSTLSWAQGIYTEENPVHGKLVFHGGDNGTFKAFFLINPKVQSTMVFFTNSSNGFKIIEPVTRMFLKDTAHLEVYDWYNI